MESDERGDRAEEVVKKALRIMELKKEISGFYQNKKNGEVDELGIDFLVYLNNGLILPIQVKASSKDNGDRRTKHLKKHPKILFIIFADVESYKRRPEKVIDSVAKEIHDFLRG